MKTNVNYSKKLALILIINLLISVLALGQDLVPSVAVINIDTKGVNYKTNQLTSLTLMELEKTGKYNVLDQYDIVNVLEKNGINANDCFGKSCLANIGSVLKSDKVLSGRIELIGNMIVISFRLIDVKSATIEKTYSKDFLNLQQQIHPMIRIAIRDMFGLDNDEMLLNSLTIMHKYDNSFNNPGISKLSLDGPRMGLICYTGKNGEIITAKKQNGGFNLYPVMFQFGYQFEIQYLNEGNFQALFELIPMLTGLDQGQAIPSFTLMNGLRNNKSGFEFAFGPSVNLVKMSSGYYDSNNEWHLKGDWNSEETNPYYLESRLDSRGKLSLTPGFIFAVGKTFRSGNLNIPVNLYVVPSKEGVRFGLSLGYNAKRN